LVGWTNAKGTGVVSPGPSNHYDFNWTSHIRGRVGYATSNVLWFVARGVALADLDYTQGSTGITTGSTFTGWTLGVGADFAITRSWIARVEYLHDDFGAKNFLIEGDPYRVKLTGDTVRGALMYKF
jgi:outer membrane immunogenic protein